jgi:hypothetical protein
MYEMKQMEVTKKNINGTDFYIKPFPAMKASNISGDLTAFLAPVLTVIVPLIGSVNDDESQEGAKGFMDIDIDRYLPQIVTALSATDGDKVETMVRKLLVDHNNVSYDDEKGNITRLTYEDVNEIFCGRIFDMYRLCYEVVKVNFGGFFDSIGSLFGSALSRSQTEETE